MTKLKNHRLKRKIKHQRLAAVLPQILYEHIYPIPKVRKIFHIAWHCLPKNLGILYLRLVLHLPDISFKDNNFLDLSIKNSFYKFFIKIFPKPILKYKFIHMGIENLIKEFKILWTYVAISIFPFFSTFSCICLLCVFVSFLREGLKFLLIRELMQKGEEKKQHHEERRMNATRIKSMSFSKSIFHFL